MHPVMSVEYTRWTSCFIRLMIVGREPGSCWKAGTHDQPCLILSVTSCVYPLSVSWIGVGVLVLPR